MRTRRVPRTPNRRRPVPPAAVLVIVLLVAGCGGRPAPAEVAEVEPSAGPPAPAQPAQPPAEAPEEPEPAAPVPDAGPSLAPEGPEANTAERAAVAASSEALAQQGDAAVAGSRLEIPAIGVSTPLLSLGLNADRTMEVPRDFSRAGWYRYSPVPGEPGPAVVAGHVTSRSGPGVFHRLSELSPGDLVEVRFADGRTATFAVTRVERHPKEAFPHDRVYGETAGSELRLITCGGEFDRSQNAHRDNVVVYASAR
ncbi:MAG TPA: class F sortase [Egibacteraceae bacterium]|nr:class F sortase [Egibacteraceae bacterium]